MTAPPQRYDARIRWLARLGIGLLRVLGATWRYRVVNDAGLRQARVDGRPVIFVLRHGQLLPLLYHHRRQGVAVLISEHGDGEIIARVAMHLGFRTVRGSTSRGASRALIGLAKEVAAGHDVAITPDGPRGPAGSFAPGALHVSQRAGAPILPIAASATRAWRMRSWDRFMVPKPFATVTVAYGPLTVVDANEPEALPDQVPRFQTLLSEAEERAGV